MAQRISFAEMPRARSDELREFQDENSRPIPFSSYKLAETTYITLALAIRSPPKSFPLASPADTILVLGDSSVTIKSPTTNRERQFPFHFIYDFLDIEKEEKGDDILDLYDDIGSSLVEHFLDGNPCGVILLGSADARDGYSLTHVDLNGVRSFVDRFSFDLFQRIQIMNNQTNEEMFQKVEICVYACMGSKYVDLLSEESQSPALSNHVEEDHDFSVTFTEVHSVAEVKKLIGAAYKKCNTSKSHFVATFHLYFKSGATESCNFVELASGFNLDPSHPETNAIVRSISTFLHCIHERSVEMTDDIFIGGNDLLSRTTRPLFSKNAVSALVSVVCPRPSDYFETLGISLISLWAGNCLKREPPFSVPWICAYDCDIQAMETHFKKGLSVDAEDDFGQTCLMWAVASASELPVSTLASSFKFNQEQFSIKEKNAAASVSFLLGNKAVVDTVNSSNINALHITAALGSLYLSKLLLDAKVSTTESAVKTNRRSFIIEDDITGTPLHFAVYKGHEDITRLLLESGVEVDSVDELGCTPLILAISQGSFVLYSLLREFGADISKADEEGNTPLIHACRKGALDIVKDIISEAKKSTDTSFFRNYVNQPNEKGACPLHQAIWDAHEDITKYLLENTPVDVNRNAGEYFSGSTPLHLVASNSLGSVFVNMLLSHGANLDTTNDDMETPLVLAVDSGDVDMAQVFLEKGANPAHCNRDGNLLIMTACRQGNIEMVDLLISSGVHVDSTKEVPAQEGVIAAMTNNAKQGPHDVRLDPNCGILSAALEGHENVIYHLMDKYKANQLMTDLFGNHIIHYLARGGHIRVLKHLLPMGQGMTSPERSNLAQLLDSPNEFGETPVFGAVSTGNMEMMEYFMAHNADLNRRTHRGKSLLHFAAANGHNDMISLLLERGLKVDCEDDERNTPLLAAAHFTKGEAATLLLERGANPNHQNIFKLALIHYSAQYGWTSQIEFLIAHNGDVNICDRRGRTALHYAASHRRDEIFRLLIDSNANVNVQDDKGYAPLHICVMEANETIVSWVVKRGAHLNLLNFKNQTPLHIAALLRDKEEKQKPYENDRLQRLTRIMFSLVEQGAVLDIADVNGESVATMLPGNILETLKEKSAKGRERRLSVNLVRKVEMSVSPSVRDLGYNVHQIQSRRSSVAGPLPVPEDSRQAPRGSSPNTSNVKPITEKAEHMESPEVPNASPSSSMRKPSKQEGTSPSSQKKANPSSSPSALQVQSPSRLTRLCLLY